MPKPSPRVTHAHDDAPRRGAPQDRDVVQSAFIVGVVLALVAGLPTLVVGSIGRLFGWW